MGACVQIKSADTIAPRSEIIHFSESPLLLTPNPKFLLHTHSSCPINLLKNILIDHIPQIDRIDLPLGFVILDLGHQPQTRIAPFDNFLQ